MQGWHQPDHDLQGFQWPHLGIGNPCKSINLMPRGTWEQTFTNFSHPYSFPCVHGLEVISFLSEYDKLSLMLGDSTMLPFFTRLWCPKYLWHCCPCTGNVAFCCCWVKERGKLLTLLAHKLCHRDPREPQQSQNLRHTVDALDKGTLLFCLSFSQPLGGTPGLGCALLGWQR